jgi:two-component system CheB/CheR fusion protein
MGTGKPSNESSGIARLPMAQQVQIIVMFAHELRSPLAAMSHALQICRASGPRPAVFAQAEDALSRQLRKARRLVEDLLDMSRVGARVPTMRLSTVNLAQTVRDATDEIRHHVLSREQKLILQIPSGPVFVSGDSLRLERVVTNLLENSSKYTPTGGQLVLNLAVERDSAVLRVRDNGRGIPPDDLEHIFDLYFQAEHLGERSRTGFGVGLALARWLVELHGGTIRAYSAGVGRGAEFTVQLPYLSAERPFSGEHEPWRVRRCEAARVSQ